MKKSGVGAPVGGRVYNLYITFICSSLRWEYVVKIAKNGHHYFFTSAKGLGHKRVILIYRLRSGTYVMTAYDKMTGRMCQEKFAREQSVVFWLERLKDGEVKI
jgi:hypothetical protein